MISSLAWIPRGAAKSVPEHAHISPDDVEALKAAAEAEAAEEQKMVSGSETSDSDSDEELSAEQTSRAHAAASQATGQSRGRVSDHFDISAAMKELDMDHYDSEGERGKMTLDRLLGGNDVSYKLEDSDEDDEDSDSEEEDLRIRDDDLLILAARNEDDVSHLEMWVYEQPDERGDGNLFVHHAILLPAFPLSLAWLDCGPNASNNSKRNLAAVGSFEPGIEIWDMDVLDTVEPIAVLGGLDSNATSSLDQNASSSSDPKKGKSKKKSSKKKSNSQLKPGSHEAPVLGLAWNKEFRNVLASASGLEKKSIFETLCKSFRFSSFLLLVLFYFILFAV
jgi:periodic tryptophan protein 1